MRACSWIRCCLADIVESCIKFELIKYLASPENWLDWAHFSLMTLGWILWYKLVNQTAKFTMAPKFNVLANVDDQTPARFLLTDPQSEKDFLLFSESISSLEQSMRFYSNIIGLCGDASPQPSPQTASARAPRLTRRWRAVILFILRLLKALNFQPRMALITRTIGTVFVDLLHFLSLFVIVFLGFTVAGYILFGHQYQVFSSFSYSAQFMVVLLLAFDPTIWVQVRADAGASFDYVQRTVGSFPVYAVGCC